MNKKISLGAAICFMAIAAAVSFTLTMYFSTSVFNAKVANINEREDLYDKIAEIDSIVRQNHLFSMDEDELLDSIADGYMLGLDDRYAVYLTKEDYRTFQLENAGKLIGVGITPIRDESGYIRILDIAADSPASNAQLQPDDLIIKVNGDDVISLGYEQAIKNLRGEEGTSVILTIRRAAEEFSVSLTRNTLHTTTVSYRMIGDSGYLAINSFDETTYDDFRYAISDLRDMGATGIIFDVRNNSGGLLTSAVNILDYLLPEGDIVSQTDSKNQTTVLYRSGGSFLDMPMVALMNGDTASAAELFVADLRDYQMAELIGVTTYGKGIMQTAYPLKDGSAIQLTTAYYNPSSGINYHEVGVKPDYEVTLTTEQIQNFPLLDETTDPQLKKAIEVLEAKKLNS